MKRFTLYFTSAAMFLGALSAVSCSEQFDPTYLEQQIKDLQSRVQTLENSLKDVNSSISSLQSIVEAINGKAYVVSVDETDGAFTFTFSDGKSTTIKVASGESEMPQIGVKEVDGVLYWTVNGQFLLGPDGSRLPVTGKDGKDGEDGADGEDGHDGKDAVAPVIGVKEVDGILYWTVNGEFLLDAEGNKVVASYPESESSSADSIFKSVKVEDGVVTITLKDGTSFVVPMRLAANLRIEANKLHFEPYETKAVHIALTNIIGVTVTEKPDGWKTSVEGCMLTIQAPTFGSGNDMDGKVVLLATSGDQTFIGKIQVTLEDPFFDMVLAPTGKMTLRELDMDFNSPGFLAGFVKADEFDAAKIIEPAKAYAPGDDTIYLSWNTVTEGNEYSIDIKDCLTPVVGERYAAYCYPGAYSRWIGVDPDPSDVFVQYFTYVEEDFTLSNVGVDKATVKASFRGAASFYGGIIRYYDDSELLDLRREFLIDAAAPFGGFGDGMYGVLMTSYSGALNMFAAMDDGEGKKNARSIVPGGKYALAFIPMDPERVYGEYTVNDVVIEPVVLETPQKTTMELVTVAATDATTTSAGANFNITSSVAKFYYRVVKKSDFEASGLSEYDYALRYGIVWDRSVVKASGAIKMDDRCTGLKPGEECIAIGVAFTSGGAYNEVSLTTAAAEVIISDGTVNVKGHSFERISQYSARITFDIECSDNIATVRYMNLSDESFGFEYDSNEDGVFETLTAGSRWEYNEAAPGESVEIYVYPEEVNYNFFALGVDKDGKFTTLVKYVYQPVE